MLSKASKYIGFSILYGCIFIITGLSYDLGLTLTFTASFVESLQPGLCDCIWSYEGLLSNMRKRGWNSSVFLTVQLVWQLHCYKMAGMRTQAFFTALSRPASIFASVRTKNRREVQPFCRFDTQFFTIHVVKTDHQETVFQDSSLEMF